MRVHFPYYQLNLDLPAGTTVHEACRLAGYPLSTACGGSGLCGKCLAIIRQNGLTAQVLACQQMISPNMEILISQDHREEKLLKETMSSASFSIDPLCHLYPVSKITLIEESKAQGKTIFETLKDWLPVSLDDLSFLTHHQLNGAIIDSDPLIAVFTIPGHEKNTDQVVAFQSHPDIPSFFGLAFDIGTTSIAGYLLDLEDGWLLSSGAELNGQTLFGADVISRIQVVKEDPNKTSDLCRSIWKTLEKLTKKLCHDSGVNPQQITAVTYCGNSVMTAFLCCDDPQFLGESPFLLVNKTKIQWTGKKLPFFHNEEDGCLPLSDFCFHAILPGIGEYIGSDTTAVLTTLPDDGQLRLIIDFGTNCEIALGKNTHFVVTSAACGPAFEGAGITMGMRSSSGAIEHCHLSGNQLIFEIIDGNSVHAKGICGSGLIDCIAVLLTTGIIQADGAFCETIPEKFSHFEKRFGTNEKDERFFTLLFPEENQHAQPIVLTQKDIRQVQLAIAAIRTGWQKLMTKGNIHPSDLSGVMLSGAFGSSIDLKNAKKIGLIPDFENIPVFTLGNGAGAGVQQVLLSRDALKKADQISRESQVINLTACSDFNDLFLNHLIFKPIHE